MREEVMASAISEADLDAALAEAHLPALLMSLVHLTGDASLLSEARRPAYVLMADGKLGGYDEVTQADIRDRAKAAILTHLAGASLPPPPSPQTVRRMMDWIAGADIPDSYAAFLTDELALTGEDTKSPNWAPDVRRSGARMKVVVVGAGMSGLLDGIRLKQAGIELTIIEKEPRCRWDVAGERLSRLPGRQSQPYVFLLF